MPLCFVNTIVARLCARRVPVKKLVDPIPTHRANSQNICCRPIDALVPALKYRNRHIDESIRKAVWKAT